MRLSRQMIKWGAAAAVAGALAVPAAQAGAPPEDPGWEGLPHCTVPDIQGVQMTVAKRVLKSALCGTYKKPMRKRSVAAPNTVLTAVPAAGTQLAPGTKVLLIVSR
jgi:PASTA domain